MSDAGHDIGDVAEVVVDRAVEGLDRPFSYCIADGQKIVPGVRVRVPLARGRAVGLVVDRHRGSCSGLKSVEAVLDAEPLMTPVLLELAAWMAERYLCYLPQALRAMIPSAIRRGVKPKTGEPLYRAVGIRVGRPSRKQDLWEFLHNQGPLSRSAILTRFPGGQAALRALYAEGAIEAVPAEVPEIAAATAPPYDLTDEQHEALKAIGQSAGVWLLEGVTGSGKTEIYLQRIADVLTRGGQALVLVPEIALTPQTLARFQERFGAHVGVWHSRLSDGERVNVWQNVKHGRTAVVVGARSAIFLPFRRLEVIVLDEEHEPSYKQEEHPRYHTRDVAIWRGRREGAQVILGSATPALETAYQARSGALGWVRLSRRVGARPLPPVQVVDMREELAAGHREIFSRLLKSRITDTLDRGRQVILFLNRRGYSTFVLCRDCGRALECPSCAVTLTYHQATGRLECHYCFHRETLPRHCPACGSERIRYFGAGTERVADEVTRWWPAARLLRADRDAVTSTEGYWDLYRRFSGGAADVLVGTQMIAKGMDFPRVGLVGVVAADTALHLPDFRSAERTFQLLVQASGRTGRGSEPGEVVIQTYNPEHYAITRARVHDYDGFYRDELVFRRDLSYPPFNEVWLLEVKARRAEDALAAADKTAARLARELAPEQILGPAPAPLAKVRDRHRYHLLVKGERAAVAHVLRAILSEGYPVSITVDPYYML